MPKWLSSLMIAVGFLALIVLAILPRNVSVDVNVKTHVDHPTNHTEAHTTINHNGPTMAAPAAETHPEEDAESDGDED